MSSPAPDDPDESRARVMKEMGRFAGLGLQFAVVMVLFTLGGHWLDQQWGTSPLFLLVGVGFAAVGSTISIVRRVPPVRGAKKKGSSPRDPSPPND